METIYLIVIISVLGPVLGSAIGVMKRTSTSYICNMLCFAAGVMLSISFLDLIPESLRISSVWMCALGILLGTALMYTLDKTIPHIHPEFCVPEQGTRLKRTSIYLIMGIFLHNFPEGMAIAIGGMADIKVSITIALAIAIHNIPEGICTSSPYFNITGKRLQAFLYSSSTAVPLLVGFLVARFLLMDIDPMVLGVITGATAGLMIYIAADELIPSACQEAGSHSTIFSLMAGVLFVVLLRAI
ncbi:MAG: ZIP family metal transporter [bacterium]